MSFENMESRLIELRRELHRNPELAFEEMNTSRLICEYLQEIGFQVNGTGKLRYFKGLGKSKTGIIAELDCPVECLMNYRSSRDQVIEKLFSAGGSRDQLTPIIIRADMDALRIQEETEFEFKSQIIGKSHACGHDGHICQVLGAAGLLVEKMKLVDSDLEISIKFLFQPAEEIAQGAQDMLDNCFDLLANSDRKAIVFGGHIDVSIPVGKIVVHQGCVNAAADQFKVEIFGSNSHAARPHQGIDAIVAGSQFVIAIQQIISREIDPAQPAVITVGEFKSGTAPNVLSGYAFLSGTVRTIDPDIRNQVKAAMKRIAKSTESLYRVRIDLGFIVETPAVINDSKFCFLVKKAVSKMGEHFEAISLSALNMGAEDFSSYLNHFKGGFVRFGARYESNDFTSGAQHSSKFAFDERVIMIGANFYLRLIEQIFSQD